MKYIIENKNWEINKEYNKEKLLYLLIDRPNLITTLNGFIWFNDKDQWHREYDLPVCINDVGDVFWHKNDNRHRDNNKPAVIEGNGVKEYWLNGKRIKTEHLK